MKAIVFAERGCAVVEELPGPSGTAPGTVLCDAVFTGMTNGTERNMLLDGSYSWKRWPQLAGYQNVARAIEVGADVEGYAVGDLVYSGSHGHVQRFCAPVDEHALTLRVPDAVAPEHAALFGVASVAMHDVRRGGVKLGERVLVVGAGLIGQFAAQCARLAGPAVTVCDLDAERLATAARLGAHATVQLTTDAASWAAVEPHGPFDVVLEASGAPVLDQVLGRRVAWEDRAPDDADGLGERFPAGLVVRGGMLAPGARVVLVAGRERVDYDFLAAQLDEVTIVHVSHFDASDLREVGRLAAEGALQIAPLVQDVVQLADAPQAYERLIAEPAALLGTVFDWRDA